MSKEPVKNWYGKILGWVEEESNGNKIYKDFYGRIVARYEKQSNVTKDFYGRQLTKGDTGIGMIYKSEDIR